MSFEAPWNQSHVLAANNVLAEELTGKWRYLYGTHVPFNEGTLDEQETRDCLELFQPGQRNKETKEAGKNTEVFKARRQALDIYPISV